MNSSVESSPEFRSRGYTLSPHIISHKRLTHKNEIKKVTNQHRPVIQSQSSPNQQRPIIQSQSSSNAGQIIQIINQLEEKQNTARKFFDDQQATFNSEISKLRDLIKKL